VKNKQTIIQHIPIHADSYWNLTKLKFKTKCKFKLQLWAFVWI